MMLSKLTTAKSRDAIAAAEMSAKDMIRRSDDVFATVSGEIFEGNEYAFEVAAMAVVHRRYMSCNSDVKTRETES